MWPGEAGGTGRCLVASCPCVDSIKRRGESRRYCDYHRDSKKHQGGTVVVSLLTHEDLHYVAMRSMLPSELCSIFPLNRLAVIDGSRANQPFPLLGEQTVTCGNVDVAFFQRINRGRGGLRFEFGCSLEVFRNGTDLTLVISEVGGPATSATPRYARRSRPAGPSFRGHDAPGRAAVSRLLPASVRPLGSGHRERSARF
jgi:hypothetical protein